MVYLGNKDEPRLEGQLVFASHAQMEGMLLSSLLAQNRGGPLPERYGWVVLCGQLGLELLV